MPTEYVMRARRTSDGVLAYWTVVGAADTSMSAANAPSPSGDYGNVVVIIRRPARPEILQESLTSQVDGSTDTFDTTEDYRAGTLTVRWNGQVQDIGDITEVDANSFSMSLTPESGDAIEVSYRPA